MAGSPAEFRADISRFVRVKVGERADAFCRQFTFNVAEKLVTTTPVDTGYARASWSIGFNALPQFQFSGDATDNPGFVPPPDFGAIALQAKAGDTIFIVNNANYIQSLEYGHSQQAPNGMVRPVIAAADAIAKLTLRQIGAR